MIISLCNLKGGAGKTTTAVNIAVYLAHKGLNVCVIDADVDQQSATIWGTQRPENVPQVDVFPISKKGFIDKVRGYEKKYDVLIVDAPPRLAGITDTILEITDLLIFPVKPSPFDLWAFEDFLEKVDEFIQEDGLPVYGVFTEFDSTEHREQKLDKSFKSAFDKYDIPVIAKIKKRQTHKSIMAYGLGSYESTNKKAKREMQDLGSKTLSLIKQLQK